MPDVWDVLLNQEALKIVSTAPHKEKAEGLLELLTCNSGYGEEQFALIMANMQNHGSNIGSPFEVRRSSESSHNVEGDQATPDD
ncbi:protein-serine/threonine phosphatase [Trifolium repens]|nr:protein-serine/threonine phosphatase [Trifolium repens]